jgi:hypothetical protein
MFLPRLRTLINVAVRIRSFSSTADPKVESQWLGPAVFSSVCLGAFGLGVWQIKRYQWKVNLLQTMADRAKEDPLEFNEMREALVGRRVLLNGTFDHSQGIHIFTHIKRGNYSADEIDSVEILLGPRAAPAGLVAPAAQGMASNPQASLVAIALLRLTCCILSMFMHMACGA